MCFFFNHSVLNAHCTRLESFRTNVVCWWCCRHTSPPLVHSSRFIESLWWPVVGPGVGREDHRLAQIREDLAVNGGVALSSLGNVFLYFHHLYILFSLCLDLCTPQAINKKRLLYLRCQQLWASRDLTVCRWKRIKYTTVFYSEQLDVLTVIYVIDHSVFCRNCERFARLKVNTRSTLDERSGPCHSVLCEWGSSEVH